MITVKINDNSQNKWMVTQSRTDQIDFNPVYSACLQVFNTDIKCICEEHSYYSYTGSK